MPRSLSEAPSTVSSNGSGRAASSPIGSVTFRARFADRPGLGSIATSHRAQLAASPVRSSGATIVYLIHTPTPESGSVSVR